MTIAKKAANNFGHLVLLVVFSWLLAAILFAAIEHTSIIDSLYWAMTTMSTVGYGDVSAASLAGKILTIVFQAWSIFYLVPCAVANVIDSVRVDRDQFSNDEQLWTEDSIKKIAAQLGVALNETPPDFEE